MKNIIKVTILFCLIISIFILPSYADVSDPWALNIYTVSSISDLTTYGSIIAYDGQYPRYACVSDNNSDVYTFAYYRDNTYVYPFFFSADEFIVYYGYGANWGMQTTLYSTFDQGSLTHVDDIYFYVGPGYGLSKFDTNIEVPLYSNLHDCIVAANDYIANQPVTPSFTKNSNVDEFIANTIISMGVKFDTPAYALSYAADAWDWCTDEDNMETANPFDEWNIDSFVSYCNAQSNNYLNWYNGYKVSEDVSNALGEYIRQNIRSLSGLPSGVTSVTGAYLPIYHYGSGFQNGSSSPTAQTFYPAQTITYFNGEYINETDDISTSQFLYTPADVRRFLGYPGSSPVITPSTPTGTGTITDDPNNPDQKNITINFPSLDWLADAIKSILDFLRDAFTTLANLLTQLLDAILGLFSDAFAGLADFGQGIIDFLQSVFAGLSTLLNGYVPSDLAVIIACFIALNFGIGLITFVLKGH